MNKKLWYSYFAGYMIYTTVYKIKYKMLRKKSIEEAERYLYSKTVEMSNFVLKKTKTTTKITGIENIPQGPCVFVSNHQGIFDGFLFFGFINKPIGFIAKKEIKKLPLISGWLEMLHTVFIDRENIRESVKAINAGVENVKSGYSMIIFPEGTRSLGGKMKEFKRGSMKLAFNAGVPVVPVTIEGTYRVLETGSQVTGNKLYMVIHKPIGVTKLTKEEKSNFAETVHDIIETELNKILDENKNV